MFCLLFIGVLMKILNSVSLSSVPWEKLPCLWFLLNYQTLVCQYHPLVEIVYGITIFFKQVNEWVMAKSRIKSFLRSVGIILFVTPNPLRLSSITNTNGIRLAMSNFLQNAVLLATRNLVLFLLLFLIMEYILSYLANMIYFTSYVFVDILSF